MCCFTGPVERVAKTNIFARTVGERQLLVYSMSYAATADLAMVLPLPVLPGGGEDALRFIALEDCPDFFAELRRGFPAEEAAEGASVGLLADLDEPVRTLQVHEVGSYEASYVPRPEDFGRLDERFRLPADLWLELNTYRDYGFAVFKLKPTEFAHVHPMAFDFPTRHGGRLFFPTLHIHDRTLSREAWFDHMLFCQPAPEMNWHLKGWEDSLLPASEFVVCPRAGELLDLEFPCWRIDVRGKRENADTWLGR